MELFSRVPFPPFTSSSMTPGLSISREPGRPAQREREREKERERERERERKRANDPSARGLSAMGRTEVAK